MPNTAQIIQVIAEHLGVPAEELDRNASLKEELGLGPIELNDLLTELSKKFDIVFSPEEVADLQTLGDLLELVEDNLLD